VLGDVWRHAVTTFSSLHLRSACPTCPIRAPVLTRARRLQWTVLILSFPFQRTGTSPLTVFLSCRTSQRRNPCFSAHGAMRRISPRRCGGTSTGFMTGSSGTTPNFRSAGPTWILRMVVGLADVVRTALAVFLAPLCDLLPVRAGVLETATLPTTSLKSQPPRHPL